MKLAAVALGLSLSAACGSSEAPPPSGPAVDNTAAAPAVPARIKGRYALAGSAARPVPLPAARVFVTIDATGAVHTGRIGTDAFEAGALAAIPKQVSHHTDDTPAGTPRLRDTVAGLLGAGTPPHVLDDQGREDIRTGGCTRLGPGPHAVSWAYSKDLVREVVAFARAPGDPSAAAVVIVADAAAPAIRLLQAADDVPIARIAVDAGKDAAAGLALDIGGAIDPGGELCIRSNRSVDIAAAAIDVQGDGIKHKGFGTIAVGGTFGTSFDRDALVAAFKASLAADLGDRTTVVDVEHDVSVALLVGALDALVEAGGTTFILHTRPRM